MLSKWPCTKRTRRLKCVGEFLVSPDIKFSLKWYSFVYGIQRKWSNNIKECEFSEGNWIFDNELKSLSQLVHRWIDGFSTFYVSDEGYIIRHIADKVMPNEDKELNPIEKVVDKLTGIPKLALFVSLSTNVAPVSFEIIII